MSLCLPTVLSVIRFLFSQSELIRDDNIHESQVNSMGGDYLVPELVNAVWFYAPLVDQELAKQEYKPGQFLPISIMLILYSVSVYIIRHQAHSL